MFTNPEKKHKMSLGFGGPAFGQGIKELNYDEFELFYGSFTTSSDEDMIENLNQEDLEEEES